MTMLFHDLAEFTRRIVFCWNGRSNKFYIQRYIMQLSMQGDNLVKDKYLKKVLILPCLGNFELHEHI